MTIEIQTPTPVTPVPLPVLFQPLVDYKIVRHGEALPPQERGLMYDYLVGQNGVFIRAKRPGLEALIPVTAAAANNTNSSSISPTLIRGLARLEPYVRFTDGVCPIPGAVGARMLEKSRQQHAPSGQPLEMLFHLLPIVERGKWRLIIPCQEQLPGSVRPIGISLEAGQSYEQALVELHSHHTMAAYFSEVDDREEQGFRIYCVIGRIFQNKPRIRVRIGVYGYFHDVSASEIFTDCSQIFGDEYSPSPKRSYQY